VLAAKLRITGQHWAAPEAIFLAFVSLSSPELPLGPDTSAQPLCDRPTAQRKVGTHPLLLTTTSGALLKQPNNQKLANSWIIVNSGGGPTPDKPQVLLETPSDLNRVNSFLNLRVADIWACYKQWRDKGAFFLTEPLDNHVGVALLHA
jgi:hypothetical protein